MNSILFKIVWVTWYHTHYSQLLTTNTYSDGLVITFDEKNVDKDCIMMHQDRHCIPRPMSRRDH